MESSKVSSGDLKSSSSKMKYSFPKSQRFEGNRYEYEISLFSKSGSPNKFYQLPDIKSKRATSFGLGNKLDMSKQNFRTPGSAAYQLHSSFDLKAKHGITMGFGRQKIKMGDMFQQNFVKPGPLQYSPNAENMRKLPSYSISPRNVDLSDRWIKSIPGPGTYQGSTVSNSELKSILSKYCSAPSSKLSHAQRKTEAEMMDPKTPGANQYNLETKRSKPFHDKKGGKFPVSLRSSLANNNNVPGPGSYNKLSDFS